MINWIKVADCTPPEETDLLLFVNGTIYQGSLVWERPSYEDTFTAFRYFIDADERCDWEWGEVTHWAGLPVLPLCP